MAGHPLQAVDRDYVLHEGRRLLFFAGTDYHRLSTHPAVIEAAMEATKQFGISAGGSRATTANHPLYTRLEEKLAGFFDCEAALLLPSGYLSNLALLQTIMQDFDTIFIDRLAHSSLRDAALVSGKRQVSFKHLDTGNLLVMLQKHLHGHERPLLMTDGIFPARGEMPPMEGYTALIKSFGGKILVDDAHAMAVSGPSGKGIRELPRLEQGLFFQTGTLSKGFGAFGGVITGRQSLIDRIRQDSAVFIGSSGLPLPAVAAAIESVSILQNDRSMIGKLQQSASDFSERLVKVGLAAEPSNVPIFSITFADEQANRDFYRALLDAEIYPSYNNYPGSPAGGHFRFVLSSHHSEAQIEQLLQVIETFGENTKQLL